MVSAMDARLDLMSLPERPAFLEDLPGPFWERMPAASGPAAMRMEGGVLLTSFRSCRAVLMNPALKKANIAILESMPGVDPAFVERRRRAILDMEGQDHLRLRRLAMPALSPAASNTYRQYMRDIMNGLIDRAGDGYCEAGAALCRPYPVPVICAVLGVPGKDVAFFTRCAADWTRWIREGPAGVPAALVAHAEMDDYLTQLVARRREHPGTDLITDLIRCEEEGDRLTSGEIINLVAGLVVAGTDTTRMALGSALYLFARHPEQWQALGHDLGLAPAAAEEVLRFAPVSALLRRIATEDLELEGMLLPEGSTVFISPGTANRDPELFPDPDSFSIHRSSARRHMTFGAGRKHCLGAHLARAELEEALAVLAQRLPGLSLAGDVGWAPDRSLLQGAVTIPVRWRRG